MKFFDSHCHLQLSQFDADRGTTISHMEKSCTAAIVVGTDLATSRAGVELAEKHDFLWASVGLHPNDNKDEAFDEQAFLALAENPKIVAIGECGLDYFRSGGTPEEKAGQKERFEKQIQLAINLNKTLIVHCRNAHDDMLEILFAYSRELTNKRLRAVIHFFTGSEELAQKYLRLGCYLSFPGPITYTDMYDESIRITPLDKILSETDSPFAAPVPHRGKRNEPAYVEHVVTKIAAVKTIPVEEMSSQIILNSQHVFGLQ
ncbi:MAG: TatD DNase family protein [Parcubacteria group bacterium Gr01-1014_56]|nr:MAG: TatD DNase family protein [Parcubacteria group bacterium Gr01-1014_56]